MSDAPSSTLPILVTGASRGLGAALAAELAAGRRHIVAVARTVGGLEETDDLVRARGGSATLAPFDITDDGAMQHLCRSVHDRWGGLSAWVHTAIHAAPLTPAPHIDPKDWSRSFAVNAEATRRLIAYAAPLLDAPDARAVFFDDPNAGGKFFGAYGASKAAQMALVGAWAAEASRIGPQVTILTPAPMATALRARFYPGEDRAALARPADEAARLAAIIAGRPGIAICDG